MSSTMIDRVIAHFVSTRLTIPNATVWEYDPEWDEIRYEPIDSEREWYEVRDLDDYDEAVPDEIDVRTISDWDYWHLFCRPETDG